MPTNYPDLFSSISGYEDIATDKNQLAYSKMTPFEDLYIRAKLQAKLWEGIYYLRTGKYYKFDNNQFNELISKYPVNIIVVSYTIIEVSIEKNFECIFI